MAKLQASVELTNYCNMRCRFCPHSVYKKGTSPTGNLYNRPQGYMSDETFELVLRNAKYLREVVLGFFGEQTMHPKFAQYAQRLRAAGNYRMVLNTNWSYVTAANMQGLKQFDLVRISIDASYADLYEELCPGGAFLDLDGGTAKDRYTTLVKKIEHWLTLPGHPETWLIYVMSSVNEHDKARFVAQWLPKTPRRDSVVTKRVISYGGVMGDRRMAKHPCRIPDQRRLVIAWNGDVSPCNLDVNMELRAGSLAAEPDLHKLLAATPWQSRLRSIRGRAGICANCFDSNNHTENVRRAGRKKT